jgi:hypothetical protein
LLILSHSKGHPIAFRRNPSSDADDGRSCSYLRASEDRLVPRSASHELSAIPRIRFADVEGPHFLLQAKPTAAAAHVQAFLREIKRL